jgi:hypothetical protein
MFPSSCPERIEQSESITPSSHVRLSLSLDGKAELKEISPPRALPPRPATVLNNLPRRRIGGLQRSQSALNFASIPRRQSQASPLPARMPSGRSRNARTWELLCDSEARDELTTQAENESSGSAIAAINLLRSTSSNNALKTNQNKRNVQPGKIEVGGPGKRAKLGRAVSSLARLQSDITQKPGPKAKAPAFLPSPSGESDKENWLPHEGGVNPRRRPPPKAVPQKSGRKRVLGDNNSVPTLAIGLGGSKSRGRKRKSGDDGLDVFEDEENKHVDPDVEQFMSGSISPSKRGDLDCVQGLLSLSQGNWR